MAFTVVVAADKTVTKETIKSGTQLVNGKVTSTTIATGGIQTILNGQAHTTIIRSSGIQRLQNGKALHTTVSAHGSQLVLKDSLASDTVLYTSGLQLVVGQATLTTINAGGTQQVVSKGLAVRTTLNASAVQQVFSQGQAKNTTIKQNAIQYVDVKGQATSTLILTKGLQRIANGGQVLNTTLSGGSQLILQGRATSTTIHKAGVQFVNGPKALAEKNIVNSLGIQQLNSNGKAKNTTLAGGSQIIVQGQAKATKIKQGGLQYLYKQAKAFNTTILASGTQQVVGSACDVVIQGGLQYVAGGQVYNTKIRQAGSQIVTKNGKVTSTELLKSSVQYISGGQSYHTIVSRGALQRVHSGTAKDTRVLRNGQLFVLYKGKATQVKANGQIVVGTDGLINKCRVGQFGSLGLAEGGQAKNITVASGGFIYGNAGAKLKNVTLLKGAAMQLAATSVLAGQNVMFGAKFYGGTNQDGVQLASRSTLTLNGQNDLANLHLQVQAGHLLVKSSANKLGLMHTTAQSLLTFDLTKLKPKTKALLTFVNPANIDLGRYQLELAKGQKLGTYTLAANCLQTKTKRYTLNVQKQNKVTLTVGQSLTSHGVNYFLNLAQNNLTLNLQAQAGKIISSASSKLVGTANCDIFWASKAKQTISGQDGRDVVVYGANKWGQNIIAKTQGCMTLVFNGVDRHELSFSQQKDNLVIARKTNAQDKIIIQKYSAATHNFVYTKSLTALQTYVQLSAPTQAQATAAREEVWRKAGLAGA